MCQPFGFCDVTTVIQLDRAAEASLVVIPSFRRAAKASGGQDSFDVTHDKEY